MRATGCARVSLLAALACSALAAAGPAFGEADRPAAEAGAAERAPSPLDEVRADLAALHFEQALERLERFLAVSDLGDAERAEGLILRAQAHVASGGLAAAEKDYEAILRLRPAFRPDPDLTPQKARERYERVRAATVGLLDLKVVPAEARVRIDGTEQALGPEPLPVVAGPHEIVVEHRGFDPHAETVTVAAGETTAAAVQLVPNARTVVVRTVPDGVEVWLDGRPVGRTSRVGRGPAELVLEYLPLGEHRFELRKECHRVERIRERLTVDLLDRAPRALETVEMVRAITRLVPVGGPPGAEVRVDGQVVGELPAARLDACSGERTIEVTAGERVLWREAATLVEGGELALRVEPRPNLALVGTREWPAELEPFASRFNRLAALEAPRGFDPTRVEDWSGVPLPPAIDLAVVPPAPARSTWLLYSPPLSRIIESVDPPAPAPRPAWTAADWGLVAVDSAVGGPARIVLAPPGGPAALAGVRPGDRVLAVGGRPIASAAELRATLAAASLAAPIAIAWVDAAGADREGELSGRTSVRVGPPASDPGRAAWEAAWARLDVVGPPDAAAPARANLALLVAEHRDPATAADEWRRVEWAERAGIGAGTVQYYLGVALQKLGRETDAARALRRAASSRATAFDDRGPPVAGAARDRLADLGATP